MLMAPLAAFSQGQVNLLVGTYTKTGKSKGIYVYDFNTQTGDAVLKSETAGVDNPSFLTLSPDKQFVYSVSENGPETAAARAFSYDRGSGKLTALNVLPTNGGSPCHIITSADNRHVIVTNYVTGNVAVFRTADDGSLAERVQLIQHEGSGPNQSRQQKAHAHSSIFSPGGGFVLVQDLGADKTFVYRYDKNNPDKPLSPADPPYASATPGGGPRHITFSADGKFVYAIQELTGDVVAYRYRQGKLELLQEISMLADGFNGRVGAADIHLSPDGVFLYASNRGEGNDIGIFRVNKKKGTLQKIGNQPVLGKEPRNFAITPDGKLLLAANQSSDEIVIFNRDTQTGLLTDTGKRIAVGAPVCLVFDY